MPLYLKTRYFSSELLAVVIFISGNEEYLTCIYIILPNLFSAMVKKLDDSVGDIVEALHEKGTLNNTIIVFVSDNGAMTSGSSINYGSNWPLRGLKMSPFEGGLRVTGAMWVPEQLPNNLFRGYIHAVDWLPTLLKAVGSEIPADIDGLNIWDDIVTNQNSSRNEMFEIDDYFGFASITLDNYKLVTGTVTTEYSNYQGGGNYLGIIGQSPSYENAIEKSKVYKYLEKMGRSATIENIKLRKKVEVKCEHPTADDELCFPNNGKHKQKYIIIVVDIFFIENLCKHIR